MSRVKLANSILKRSLKALGYGAGGGLAGGSLGFGLGLRREIPVLTKTLENVRALPEVVDISAAGNLDKLRSMGSQAKAFREALLGATPDKAYLDSIEHMVNSGRASDLGRDIFDSSKYIASGRVGEDVLNLGAAGGLAGLGVGGYGLLKSLRKPKVVIPVGGL